MKNFLIIFMLVLGACAKMEPRMKEREKTLAETLGPDAPRFGTADVVITQDHGFLRIFNEKYFHVDGFCGPGLPKGEFLRVDEEVPRIWIAVFNSYSEAYQRSDLRLAVYRNGETVIYTWEKWEGSVQHYVVNTPNLTWTADVDVGKGTQSVLLEKCAG